VNIDIDRHHRIVRIELVGPILADDIIEAWARLAHAEEPPLPLLWDFRGGRLSSMSGREIRRVVACFSDELDAMKMMRSAFVVGRPADFGVARMIEGLAGSAPENSLVTYDLDEAIAFLS